MSIPDTPSVYRWEGVAERADRVLVHLGAVRSRSHAQQVISASRVKIAGNIITKAGHRVLPGDQIEVQGLDHYVSRGAHKLLHALETFDISARGRIALDVGASTGGFTQVLLERGATTVLAVDVGHGQLAPELLRDERVKLWEGSNARYLTREDLAEHTGVQEQPDLVVGDLSFISLTHVLEPLTNVIAPDGSLVMLIKPQFEVGKDGVGDGVVTDPGLREQAIRTVIDHALSLGLSIQALTDSPILGGLGNREYLIHMLFDGLSGEVAWREMITLS